METRESRLKNIYLLVQKLRGITLVVLHRNLRNGAMGHNKTFKFVPPASCAPLDLAAPGRLTKTPCC